MKKIMKLWTKISSFGLIIYSIYLIYTGIKISLISLNPLWPTPILTPLLQILSVIFSIGSMVVFYGPLFYYGWVKKPKNEIIKYWSRGLTIIFPLFAIMGFISPWGLGFPKDIFLILPIFALIVPLYYYSWGSI